MFDCPVCTDKFCKINLLRRHICARHILRGWKAPYTCGQECCPRTFPSIKSWELHVKRCHGYLAQEQILPHKELAAANRYLHIRYVCLFLTNVYEWQTSVQFSSYCFANCKQKPLLASCFLNKF